MKTQIIYHSKYGQTEKIATRISELLTDAGHDVERIEINEVNKQFSLEACDAVVIGGPLYATAHAKQLKRFVRNHHETLNRLPTAFFSVSLSAAGDESQRADAMACMDRFLSVTGWKPNEKQILAGALPYRRYGWFIRMLMKRMVKKTGGGTDTSKNYEYTDWNAVNDFANRLAGLFKDVTKEADETPVSANFSPQSSSS